MQIRSTSDLEFDHTSIAKTILLRFVGPEFDALGARMARAHHLGELLEPTARSDRPQFDPPDPPDPEDPPGGGQLPLVPTGKPRPPVPVAAGGRDGDEFHEAVRRFGRPIL